MRTDQVHESADGLAGLELVKGSQPDLVILDWMMPHLSGLDVCRELRADHALESTPVLMVTSRSTAADQSAALAAGASAFLTKPFELLTFIDTVADLLESGSVPGTSAE